MLCPYCSFENSKVLESRTTSEKSSIRRRRECEKCQKRFTTYEKIELAPLIVLKRNGSREEYSREKLFGSLISACSKSNIHVETLYDIIDEIEIELSQLGRREISTFYLGEKILEVLKDLNEIAYIRYASIFKEFKTLDDLTKEINQLRKQLVLFK